MIVTKIYIRIKIYKEKILKNNKDYLRNKIRNIKLPKKKIWESNLLKNYLNWIRVLNKMKRKKRKSLRRNVLNNQYMYKNIPNLLQNKKIKTNISKKFKEIDLKRILNKYQILKSQ